MPVTVTADLLACAERVCARVDPPRVSALHLPAQRACAGIESEFGLVVLDDGSAGLFFALLDDTLRRLHDGVHARGAAGCAPLALARGIVGDDAVERAVALGAIAALTRHLFRRAGYVPPAAANALGGAEPSRGDHVGMVGLFPSLARRLRAQGVALTVLELRADKVERGDRYEVTLDPARLRECSHVLCTASTLLNGTLDGVLAHVAAGAHVALIGPSASCFPDPLFARGVQVVGGSAVLDAGALGARLVRGDPWGDAVSRYAIDARGYPGLDALLDAAGAGG